MGTIYPKIPEIPGGKSNGTEIPGKKFAKIWGAEFFVEWKAPKKRPKGNELILKNNLRCCVDQQMWKFFIKYDIVCASHNLSILFKKIS